MTCLALATARLAKCVAASNTSRWRLPYVVARHQQTFTSSTARVRSVARSGTRTVCFLCTPEARVIDKYWYGFPSVMHCHKHKTKCSECGVGPGYIHVRGREFEYRLCAKCAPDAVNCRRWVRDLRG